MAERRHLHKKKIIGTVLKIINSLIILAVLLVPAGCKKESRFAFVTAPSGLVMRKSPGVQSERIGLIPCGTRVELTGEEGPEETINGLSGRWRLVAHKENRGWAFDGFLRILKIELEKKISRGNYSLKAASEEGISMSDSGYTISEEVLPESGGDVTYRSTLFLFNSQEISEYRGKLTFNDETITLTLPKGTRAKYEIELPDSRKVLKSSEEIPALKLILRWSESLKAFVKEQDMKLVNNPAYIIRTKDCRIISIQDEKNMEIPGAQFKTTGYFCEQ